MSDDPDEFRGLVAKRGGRVVGIASYLLHRSLRSVEDTCT